MSIVNVKKENREAFISRFEKQGFTIDKIFSRNDILNSFLPITIDFDKKEIGRIGNVTCAAALSQCGRIETEEEFNKEIETKEKSE